MKKDYTKKFLERLKELREEAGMSQTDVARLLNVSRTNYNRYENGTREIPREFLYVLANEYNVTLDYLMGYRD